MKIEDYQQELATIFKKHYEESQAKEAVYLTIKEAIIKRVLPNGISLNSTYLSKLFYLSRTPVENALARLSYEQLILPNLQNGYITYGLNFKETRDSNEFTLYLYLVSNMMANQKIDFYYNNLLQKQLEKIEGIMDLKSYLFAGSHFHFLIAESTGNLNLVNTMRNEIDKSSLITLDFTNTKEKEEFIKEHKKKDKELLHVINHGSLEDVVTNSIEHNQHMLTLIFQYMGM